MADFWIARRCDGANNLVECLVGRTSRHDMSRRATCGYSSGYKKETYD